jgi:hypothetical protein
MGLLLSRKWFWGRLYFWVMPAEVESTNRGDRTLWEAQPEGVLESAKGREVTMVEVVMHDLSAVQAVLRTVLVHVPLTYVDLRTDFGQDLRKQALVGFVERTERDVV